MVGYLARQTAIYRPWNDTGHGSWVSITGQGGAILPAGASAQTAIDPVALFVGNGVGF
jgi:hypothetical protein